MQLIINKFMNQHKLSKDEIIDHSRQYYQYLIQTVKPTAFTLNVSLTSNPFLKDADAFKHLKFQLADYNKRVERGSVRDPYQMLSYQKLHSMMSDLAQIDTRQDQATALGQLQTWFKEQARLVQQRNDQGEIRYKMSKDLRSFQKMTFNKDVQQQQDELNIPFYLIQRIIDPYRRHWRTIHNDYPHPDQRLLQYKRKTINIATFAQQKQQQKPPRVLYPMPPKYQEPKDENQDKPEGQQGAVVPAEGVVPGQQGAPPAENAQNAQQAAGQPDMGGMGQQPQEPDQDEPPEDVPDKLRPKNPIYTDAISKDTKPKYKQAYLFYQGSQNKTQRNMQLRYVRRYQDILKRQRQDQAQIEIAHDWAKRKAKMTKDVQKKLQEMKINSTFAFSKEPAPNQQRISAQDQIRFGFTTAVRTRPKTNEFDMSLNELPKIGSTPFQEKTIRRDRLQSLKGKFGKLLNLVQHEDREASSSMCQVTARRRGLSQIIRNHSHSKERLHQLQQVSKLKEKLTKVKVNVNIKALSMGLCLPQGDDDQKGNFPEKQLPSNPNMVETKKKKKKK